MLAYAANEFTLSARTADGTTARDQLNSLWRQTKVMPKELEPVECHESVLYLWRYFLSMNARRSHNEAGPQPIGHAEVDAWARVRHLSLSPFDLSALDQLEALYLTQQAKK